PDEQVAYLTHGHREMRVSGDGRKGRERRRISIAEYRVDSPCECRRRRHEQIERMLMQQPIDSLGACELPALSERLPVGGIVEPGRPLGLEKYILAEERQLIGRAQIEIDELGEIADADCPRRVGQILIEVRFELREKHQTLG